MTWSATDFAAQNVRICMSVFLTNTPDSSPHLTAAMRAA